MIDLEKAINDLLSFLPTTVSSKEIVSEVVRLSMELAYEIGKKDGRLEGLAEVTTAVETNYQLNMIDGKCGAYVKNK